MNPWHLNKRIMKLHERITQLCLKAYLYKKRQEEKWKEDWLGCTCLGLPLISCSLSLHHCVYCDAILIYSLSCVQGMLAPNLFIMISQTRDETCSSFISKQVKIFTVLNFNHKLFMNFILEI